LKKGSKAYEIYDPIFNPAACFVRLGVVNKRRLFLRLKWVHHKRNLSGCAAAATCRLCYKIAQGKKSLPGRRQLKLAGDSLAPPIECANPVGCCSAAQNFTSG
jgi:hypothetical protein